MHRGSHFLEHPRQIPTSILVEETMLQFKYDPRLLRPSSCRLVLKRFDCCGKIEPRPFRYACLHQICLHCSNKINALGEHGKSCRSIAMKRRAQDPSYVHPTKGVGHSSVTIQKMRDAPHPPYPPALRLLMSAKFSGDGNPFFGKKHTQETRQKLASGASARAKRGPLSNFFGRVYHGKGAWILTKQGLVWVRSSYEVSVVCYLDIMYPTWVYEPGPFEVSYFYNGVLYHGTYTPDFWVDALSIYIEVKGYWRDDALAKFNAFREQYPSLKIEVWDKPTLLHMGIL